MLYTFNRWMKIQFFHILFESYADDTICHCSTESGAKIMKEVICRRFEECYLTLKRDKKKSYAVNTGNLRIHMSGSIIICGIVKNAEKGLKRNIPIINALCSRFDDFKIYIYENDSCDDTKKLLKEWHDSNPNNVFVSVNNTDPVRTIPSAKEVGCFNPFYSSRRISKMVSLRNRYLEFIEEEKWIADYIMVVDLDVAALNLDAIMSSFASENQWDAVTAFGYSTSPKLSKRYHDTYALTEYGDQDNPQTEVKIKSLAEKYGKMINTDKWIRVFSAFGGLAIYKFEAIKGIRYQLLKNSDERVEVRCEHYSIYKQMSERGFNKVFINPAMVLKYQNLTCKIIINSIKRRLGI